MSGLQEVKVKDVMTSDVFSVEVPGHRDDALGLMKDKNVSGLPVVEKKNKKFLGMITRHDIYDKPSRVQTAMLYEENIATIFPESTVDTLVRRFIETGQYWIPVVERDRVVGIVTPSDLMPLVEKLGKGMSVIDFMGRHSCVPIYLKSPLSVALHILRITRIPALPVVDERGQLVGIVSDLDVFRILESEKKRQDLRLNVEDDDWTWEGIRYFYQTYAMPGMKLPDMKVENVMVKKVIRLYPRSDAAGAAKAMRVNNIGQLPICGKDNLLIGVLYNYDLLSALLQGK